MLVITSAVSKPDIHKSFSVEAKTYYILRNSRVVQMCQVLKGQKVTHFQIFGNHMRICQGVTNLYFHVWHIWPTLKTLLNRSCASNEKFLFSNVISWVWAEYFYADSMVRTKKRPVIHTARVLAFIQIVLNMWTLSCTTNRYWPFSLLWWL